MSDRALVIGISQYPPEFTSLPAVSADVREIAKLLGSEEGRFDKGDVVVLTDEKATRAQVLKELKSTFGGASREQTTFIYLAGHGEPVGGDYYFLPFDVEEKDIPSTGISLAEIKEMFDESPCERLFLLLDFCHSGAILARSAGAKSQEQAEKTVARALGVIKGSGRVIMCACTADLPLGDTAGWTVLHSLGLSRRGRKPFGEIDFVVLIPEAGVFCLEVKGGGVSCHDGVWQTVNRTGAVAELKRSPFAQAREGMFALRDAVLNRAPVGFPSGIVFGYAVVMPDVPFTAKSPEWEAHQILDRDALRKPISVALRVLAAEQRRLLNIHSADKEPTRANIGILTQILRPDFDAVVTRGTQIEQTEERLLQLTQEQFDALDLLADNPRCLFHGAAGTGKTMLALEYARRSAQSGLRTLLVCFNRLLGDWLDRQIASSTFRAELTAGRYFKLLRERIMRSSLATEFAEKERNEHGTQLYDQVYGAFGSLAIEEIGETYDVLVVDEAQDLLYPGVLDAFGAWLKGGLAGGRWAIFGDFERQAIFGSRNADNMKALLVERAPHFSTGRLRQNCRNTRSIGEETALLSGFESLPYRVGQIGGLAVDYRYYDSPTNQRAVLADVLRRLMADGIKASDIVVLSRNRLSNSAVAGADGGTDFKLVEVADVERSRVPVVRFATIQAFKGMESPVVILCDVSQVSENEPQALLYVAMSRARSQLTVLVDEVARPLIRECLHS